MKGPVAQPPGALQHWLPSKRCKAVPLERCSGLACRVDRKFPGICRCRGHGLTAGQSDNAARTQQCNPSFETLTDWAEFGSVNTAKAAIKELKALRKIHVDKVDTAGGRQNNVYTLLGLEVSLRPKSPVTLRISPWFWSKPRPGSR